MTAVHESLEPYVDAAREAGFDVHVPSSPHFRGPAGFVYLSGPDQPGCALLQVGDFPRLGARPTLSVPVRPDREHGSAVHVDFEGAPEELGPVLERVLASGTVLTRFVPSPRRVAVDRRIPDAARLLPARTHETLEEAQSA